MSDAFGVKNDGTPRAALDIAGQAVRAFNHQTGTRFASHRNGWNHVPDVYRCLGELYYLIGMVPQVTEHMSESMQAALDAGHAEADAGSQYDGRPEAAIATARAQLADAATAARTVYAALSAAQTTLSRIHYAGPELEGDDD